MPGTCNDSKCYEEYIVVDEEGVMKNMCGAGGGDRAGGGYWRRASIRGFEWGNERMRRIVSSAACTERLATTLPQDSPACCCCCCRCLTVASPSPPLPPIDPTTPITHLPSLTSARTPRKLCIQTGSSDRTTTSLKHETVIPTGNHY